MTTRQAMEKTMQIFKSEADARGYTDVREEKFREPAADSIRQGRAFLATLLCAMLAVSAAFAEPTKLSDDTPIGAQITKIFDQLKKDGKTADEFTTRLRELTAKTPQEAKKQFQQGADILGEIVDQLAPTGALTAELAALRAAAVIHRNRVQETPKDTIEETMRTNILQSWDRAVRAIDSAQPIIGEVRSLAMNELERLRMRQAAISELMLAGQYEAAAVAFNKWITDLKTTVKALNDAVGGLGIEKVAPSS